MTKRSRMALKTREKILDSAKKLFHEKGFEAVTIEDITNDAGVARGSFYTYFKSKSDIIVSEFRIIDAYYKKYAPNLRRYDSAISKLTAFTRAQMRYVKNITGNEQLKVLYANQTLEPGKNKIITDRNRYWHNLIKKIIEDGQDSGEIRIDLSAEELTVWFNRSIRGLFLDWCITSDEDFDLIKEGVHFCNSWLSRSLGVKEANE